MSFRLCIEGDQGTGKTLFALANHPKLGSREYVPVDPGAFEFEGVPPPFREGLKVVRPYVKPDGSVKDGNGQVAGWREYSTKARKVDTTIIDTITSAGEMITNSLRVGMKDPRKAFYEAQSTLINVYRNLYDLNPNMNIVLLHHLDEITKRKTVAGEERLEFVSYVPATSGSALNRRWGGRFTAVLHTKREIKASVDRSGGLVTTHRYKLQLRPDPDHQFIKLRGGLREIPHEIDFTCDGDDVKPILDAWDFLFSALEG